MLNLRQLRYFVGIVDSGSFSRAAVLLRIAQPALSEQIANLERELKATLLLRSQRGVQPTSAGMVVYRSAKAILNEVEHLQTSLQAPDDIVGEVLLGLTSSFSETFTEPIVSAVLAKHPKIRINVVDGPGNLHHDGLLRGTVDIAVLHEHVKAPGIKRAPLYRQALYYVEKNSAGRGVSQPATIAMADLLQRSFVLPAMPNPSRAVIENAFLALGAKPRVVAEGTSKSALMSLVAGGVGGTVLAWGGRVNPAFRWSKIVAPCITHDVSICHARLLPHGEAVEVVQSIAWDVIMRIVKDAGWQGAIFPDREIS